MRRSWTLLVLATLLLGTALGCGTTDDAGSDEGSAGETTEPTSEVEPASPTTAEATTTTADQTTTTGDDGDDSADDGGDGDGDAAVCEPLRDVSDLDKQFSADLEAGGEWSVIQGKIVEGSEELVDAYDEAIELAPDDLTESLTALRDFTEGLIDVARTSVSLEDFGTKVVEDPNAIAAGAAALDLDEFSQETCGFSTSNE